MKGQIGDVDKIQAQNEWDQLFEGFRELCLNVEILEGKEGLPDMVFCANQSLLFIDQEGSKKNVMVIMKTEQRKPEAIENWFRTRDYEFLHLHENKIQTFEGMGDSI